MQELAWIFVCVFFGFNNFSKLVQKSPSFDIVKFSVEVKKVANFPFRKSKFGKT
jgi:hypothetical protein